MKKSVTNFVNCYTLHSSIGGYPSQRKTIFVKLEEHVVDIFALREKPETLYIDGLAVAPEHRKRGIGTCILTYTSKLAKRMSKK